MYVLFLLYFKNINIILGYLPVDDRYRVIIVISFGVFVWSKIHGVFFHPQKMESANTTIAVQVATNHCAFYNQFISTTLDRYMIIK